MKTLVTGASGFIGRAVVERLTRDGKAVRGSVRRTAVALARQTDCVLVGDLGPNTEWDDALDDVDTVVHTAARVHVMREASAHPLTEFRAVNVAGTLQLARRAQALGARRFVYLSSVKVNGEETAPGRPFTADDVPAPVDPYGISKHEAEIGLRELASATGLEVVIIRPPLVYGPGVRGNLLSLMRWLYRRLPLPFGGICNRRSLVALENLVDFIVACANRPEAANQTFLVSDDEDLSTPDLSRRLAVALGVPARLIPIPDAVRLVGIRFPPTHAIANRLFGNLQVELAKTHSVLGWAPVASVNESLASTAQHFLNHEAK